MELREGYKKTEYGLIPEDWELLVVDDVISFSGGSQPPRDTFIYKEKKGYIRLLQIRDYKTEKYKTYIPEKLGRKFCTKDDIMIGRYGPPIFQILRGYEGAYNVALIKAIPSPYIEKSFAFYFLKQTKLFSFIEKLSQRSSGQTGVDLLELKKYPIPLPPLPEQKAIAEVLSDIDSLLQAIEQKLAKKRAIKQGAMQKLLTPKEDWEVKKLGEIGKTFGGLSGKTKSDFSNGNSKYIPFMNIMSNPVIDITYLDSVFIKPNESQNKALQGDLFFNGSSETPEEVGLCSVLLKNISNLYLNSFCFGFRLFSQDEISGLYLAYFFRSDEGRKLFYSLAQGATRYNLSKSNFLKLEFPIPSFEKQVKIATIFSDMDKEIELIEKQLSKYKTIKQGLMQELLTGRIRLTV